MTSLLPVGPCFALNCSGHRGKDSKAPGERVLGTVMPLMSEGSLGIPHWGSTTIFLSFIKDKYMLIKGLVHVD